MANVDLNSAKKKKKDEFYTQLSDIEKEMIHYHEDFKNKIILCNCDDPYESNFFKYFAMNFNRLGLKKLIATCYSGSPVSGKQLSLDDVFGLKNQKKDDDEGVRKPYKIEITEVTDENGDGATDLSDIEFLIKNKKNLLTLLKGNGDFRSQECIEILKEADIVVTNPPFSLFREFVAQLVEYDKKFIILGNMNSISYKEIFPLIIQGKLWIGYSIHSGDRKFMVPDDYPLEATGWEIDNEGRKYIRVKGVRWFTNIDVDIRHENLVLYRSYTPEDYPQYDNYRAINVDTTADIPDDYDGVMGVPITFLDKFNPDQFTLIGTTESEGRGFSHGLWMEESKVSQPLINGKKKYKRLFIQRKR